MKIIMCKGLDGSGKSEWAKAEAKTGNYIIIHKDDIRGMLGDYKENQEKYVLRMRNDLIRSAIKMKKNVIVVDNNLNPMHERTLKQLAKELGVKFQVNDSFLKVPPEICVERDLKRGEKAVGPNTIWQDYFQWVSPIPVIKLGKDFNKPRCVICDVEGSLLLDFSKRPFDSTAENKSVIDPFMACVLDSLYTYGIESSGKPYPSIILISTREEKNRDEVEKWLSRNLVPYDKLYMRQDGDTRPDMIIKKEIYRQNIDPLYSVLGVFDARNDSAHEWRKLGLRVAQLGYPEINF